MFKDTRVKQETNCNWTVFGNVPRQSIVRHAFVSFLNEKISCSKPIGPNGFLREKRQTIKNFMTPMHPEKLSF